MGIENPDWAAMLGELRKIRSGIERANAALERGNNEQVAYTYEQAAKQLGCSKRSVERLVALGRLKPRDIGGPKIPASQLRDLADGDLPQRRHRGHPKPRAEGDVTQESQETMAKVRELVRQAQRGGQGG